ncbi:hypothetical protein ABL78_0061 [Leptomonas seymouri]|uniref:LicD/FKTN/FKRP nucleotidyltransferase domain-containing protein n=1 Tax=Leptomonas seymouri TaxID=5684 RepID=A0A0N1IMW8_LEPSE|nr:hypothetical protein ABL78_0061 [Leptomonas seymouri]|eukprot:KPI90828.1 hypothetical protein ABL78_0061 [Leptomonas seymouri]
MLYYTAKAMQCNRPRLCGGVSCGFRPHLHRIPCVVCEAAEAAYCSKRKKRSTAVQARSRYTTETALTVGATKLPSLLPSTRQTASATSSALPTSSHFLVEQRRAALSQWMQTFSAEGRLSGPANYADSGANSPPLLRSREEFDACYSTYLRCHDTEVPGDLYRTLLHTLDQQCTRINVPQSVAGRSCRVHSETSATSSSIRIPTHLLVPRVDANSPAETSANSSSFASDAEPTNIFEGYVRQLFPSDPAAVAKQLAFQEALLSLREVLDEQRVAFFLACGTALGARRNGCFIPYDEDIDVGILYTDLCTCSPGNASESSAPHPFPPASDLQRCQGRLFELIHALASASMFLVFDVCGAVEKGLELRVLHIPTNTRIDINLYYPPVPGCDDALVQAEGPFLWASSFYEAASRRAHHMYRYRHRPFEKELARLPFCVRRADADGFWVPPERYLIENYGEDWHTPKQYTYTEGLSKEFKNIIDE